jgi:hypothetical protein
MLLLHTIRLGHLALLMIVDTLLLLLLLLFLLLLLPQPLHLALLALGHQCACSPVDDCICSLGLLRNGCHLQVEECHHKSTLTLQGQHLLVT